MAVSSAQAELPKTTQRVSQEARGEPHSYCALRAISISRMLSSASFTLRSRYDFFCCKAESPEES